MRAIGEASGRGGVDVAPGGADVGVPRHAGERRRLGVELAGTTRHNEV